MLAVPPNAINLRSVHVSPQIVCVKHPTLKNTEMLAVPPNAIHLRSVDGSPLEILGYVRSKLTLGDITLPVEALVSPNLV